jgi:hypothetical protein
MMQSTVLALETVQESFQQWYVANLRFMNARWMTIKRPWRVCCKSQFHQCSMDDHKASMALNDLALTRHKVRVSF